MPLRPLRLFSAIVVITVGFAHSLVDSATARAAEATSTVIDRSTEKEAGQQEGWISLFNGKDLSGWKANENKASFRVVDGQIVVKGPRSHLFYVGPVNQGKFKNFDWKCDIQTKPNSNSGMYIHTEFLPVGWPSQGYEIQVNNTHGDPRKTGGLYAIADVMDKSPAEDGKWFQQHVIVQGKHIILKVDGKVTTDYTEPEHPQRDDSMKGRLLSEGTIALQGHDPGSEVHYRNIMIKLLP